MTGEDVRCFCQRLLFRSDVYYNDFVIVAIDLDVRGSTIGAVLELPNGKHKASNHDDKFDSFNLFFHPFFLRRYRAWLYVNLSSHRLHVFTERVGR